MRCHAYQMRNPSWYFLACSRFASPELIFWQRLVSNNQV
jgi:hypothetical protein